MVAVKEKLFPDLSEDCWLLFADGFGSRTARLLFSWVERFEGSAVPPRNPLPIPIRDWCQRWNCGLRPDLLPSSTRTLYHHVAANSASRRLGEIASIGIGYASCAGGFVTCARPKRRFGAFPLAATSDGSEFPRTADRKPHQSNTRSMDARRRSHDAAADSQDSSTAGRSSRLP